MRRALSLVGLLCLAGLTARAQDPVNLDPKQYKVEIENAQVRVLRVHHDPQGRSSMHEHPAGVVVWLTDDHEKLTFPNGKTQESHSKAGQVSWITGTKHAVENVSDKPFEVIFVELKAQPATSKPPAAKKKRESQVSCCTSTMNSVLPVVAHVSICFCRNRSGGQRKSLS